MQSAKPEETDPDQFRGGTIADTHLQVATCNEQTECNSGSLLHPPR
jgi:hypothetical protein